MGRATPVTVRVLRGDALPTINTRLQLHARLRWPVGATYAKKYLSLAQRMLGPDSSNIPPATMHTGKSSNSTENSQANSNRSKTHKSQNQHQRILIDNFDKKIATRDSISGPEIVSQGQRLELTSQGLGYLRPRDPVYIWLLIYYQHANYSRIKSNQIKFIRYTRSQNTNRKLENKNIKRT